VTARRRHLDCEPQPQHGQSQRARRPPRRGCRVLCQRPARDPLSGCVLRGLCRRGRPGLALSHLPAGALAVECKTDKVWRVSVGACVFAFAAHGCAAGPLPPRGRRHARSRRRRQQVIPVDAALTAFAARQARKGVWPHQPCVCSGAWGHSGLKCTAAGAHLSRRRGAAFCAKARGAVGRVVHGLTSTSGDRVASVAAGSRRSSLAHHGRSASAAVAADASNLWPTKATASLLHAVAGVTRCSPAVAWRREAAATAAAHKGAGNLGSLQHWCGRLRRRAAGRTARRLTSRLTGCLLAGCGAGGERLGFTRRGDCAVDNFNAACLPPGWRCGLGRRLGSGCCRRCSRGPCCCWIGCQCGWLCDWHSLGHRISRCGCCCRLGRHQGLAAGS
jgi:hypothetical protein